MKKKLHQLILYTTVMLGAVNLLSGQSITAGGSSTFALCDNGTVMRWGYINGGGNLWSPTPISALADVVKIDANANCFFAIKNDGTVWTYGANDYGGLAVGSNGIVLTPTQVPNLTDIIAVSSGQLHSLFLKSDGTVWASGWNVYGELGIGNNTSTNVAVLVPGLDGITAISAGKYHSVALKNDGTVWVWGSDAFSQLGNGSPFAASNVPLQVAGISGVIAIDAGMYFTHVLKNDGTVWGWGQNYNGELGCGETANTFFPVQTAGLTDIVSIADGYTHGFAIKNDGTVYAWGSGSAYQLGNGLVTTQYLPVVIPALAGSVKIVSGEFHSLAVKNDGTVRSWGYNTNGQLGNGSTAWNETPGLVASSLCPLLSVAQLDNSAVEISIFPNPAKETFQIKVSDFRTHTTVEVYNCLGSLVQTKAIDNEITTINSSRFAKGLYFIKVMGDKNTTVTQKLLIN